MVSDISFNGMPAKVIDSYRVSDRVSDILGVNPNSLMGKFVAATFKGVTTKYSVTDEKGRSSRREVSCPTEEDPVGVLMQDAIDHPRPLNEAQETMAEFRELMFTPAGLEANGGEPAIRQIHLNLFNGLAHWYEIQVRYANGENDFSIKFSDTKKHRREMHLKSKPGSFRMENTCDNLRGTEENPLKLTVYAEGANLIMSKARYVAVDIHGNIDGPGGYTSEDSEFTFHGPVPDQFGGGSERTTFRTSSLDGIVSFVRAVPLSNTVVLTERGEDTVLKTKADILNDQVHEKPIFLSEEEITGLVKDILISERDSVKRFEGYNIIQTRAEREATWGHRNRGEEIPRLIRTDGMLEARVDELIDDLPSIKKRFTIPLGHGESGFNNYRSISVFLYGFLTELNYSSEKRFPKEAPTSDLDSKPPAKRYITHTIGDFGLSEEQVGILGDILDRYQDKINPEKSSLYQRAVVQLLNAAIPHFIKGNQEVQVRETRLPERLHLLYAEKSLEGYACDPIRVRGSPGVLFAAYSDGLQATVEGTTGDYAGDGTRNCHLTFEQDVGDDFARLGKGSTYVLHGKVGKNPGKFTRDCRFRTSNEETYEKLMDSVSTRSGNTVELI